MNRSKYFNYIEERLNLLSLRITRKGKINLLDLNIHSETFFADMINMTLGLKLRNYNAITQNVEGIDLLDNDNRVIAQVSAICTKAKVNDSLSKEALDQYRGYTYKFISIAKDAEDLRRSTFNNLYQVTFNPQTDILDVSSILRIVLCMEIEQQKRLYIFIRDELGDETASLKYESNLATIISIISSEDLRDEIFQIDTTTFEIDRKIEFNNLPSVKCVIDQYKIYCGRLDEKYAEFDKQGVNKSLSVFRVINSQYARLIASIKDESQLFFAIIDGIINIITNSANYKEIPYDELEMCVSILVVDAFIRCKIFRNPEGYSYATTR